MDCIFQEVHVWGVLGESTGADVVVWAQCDFLGSVKRLAVCCEIYIEGDEVFKDSLHLWFIINIPTFQATIFFVIWILNYFVLHKSIFDLNVEDFFFCIFGFIPFLFLFFFCDLWKININICVKETRMYLWGEFNRDLLTHRKSFLILVFDEDYACEMIEDLCDLIMCERFKVECISTSDLYIEFGWKNGKEIFCIGVEYCCRDIHQDSLLFCQISKGDLLHEDLNSGLIVRAAVEWSDWAWIGIFDLTLYNSPIFAGIWPFSVLIIMSIHHIAN